MTETYRQIAENAGYVSNLMAVVAHAPEGLSRFAGMDSYCRSGLDLTPRQRELAILIAMRDLHYGWTHRAPIGRAMGLTAEQLLLIHEGRCPRDLPEQERALCDFAFEITAYRRIPPRLAEAVLHFFSPRQIVDIALVVSHHMASAALVAALDVRMESEETLKLEQEWETRGFRAAKAKAEEDEAAGGLAGRAPD